MYVSGHLLASSALAIPLAKKLNINYVFCASLMMLTNIIDTDHLLQYQLDNGFADSLTLHYAHHYAALPLFLLLFCGILFQKFRAISLITAVGISFHLVCDIFANIVHYNFFILGSMDFIMLLILFLFLKEVVISKQKRNKMLLFFIFVLFYCNFSQYYISIIKGIKPNENILPYGYATICNILLPILFYLLFKKKNQAVNG